MFDQWESLLAYALGALLALILLGLVIRFRRQIFPQSLRNRLPLAFLSVAVISVGVVILAVSLQIRATLELQKSKDALVQAELSRNRLAEQIANQVFWFEDLSSSYSVANQIAFGQRPLDAMSNEERTAYFQEKGAAWADPDEEFLRRSVFFNPVSVELRFAGSDLPLFSQIIATDAYGGLAGVMGEVPDKFYFGNEVWWQNAKNSGQGGTLFFGKPYLTQDDQAVLVDIVLPLFSTRTAGSSLNSTPVFQGVLRAQLHLSNFSVFTESGLGENVELALVDNINNIWLFSSTDPQKVGTQIPSAIQEVIADISLSSREVGRDETGQRVIRSHAELTSSSKQPYLDGLGLTIVVQQEAANALTNIGDFLRPIFVGGLIALVLASIIGYVTAWQIARPLISLSDAAVTMAGGQLGHRAPESGPTELQTLARSFNSMTSQLQQMLVGLEQQVEARTERLEIVATLGERLSSILKLEDLLTEVVKQLQDRFAYYHVHIYLLDKEEQNLLVAAGTGLAGVQMKAQGHSIPVNAVHSLVARAMRTGEIVHVDDVRQTPDWLPNPLLPDTCSEMAVPITFKGKVVGVLDVQQNQVAGLDNSDAALLRSLANQVAVATNNARLFTEVETALAEAREIQRRFIEQAWDKDVVSRRSSGRVQFSLGESTTLNETVLAKARQQALTQTGPSLITVTDQAETVRQDQPGPDEAAAPAVDSGNQHQVLVAPIVLGETVIGNFQLHEVDSHTHWSEGELALITAVIDQVAQTAENLRLLNETQERASREQLIGQVSDKLRRAPDMETLMKVATAEIARVLNPARTYIRFDRKAGDGTGKTGETPANGNGRSDIEMPQHEKDAGTVAENFEE